MTWVVSGFSSSFPGILYVLDDVKTAEEAFEKVAELQDKIHSVLKIKGKTLNILADVGVVPEQEITEDLAPLDCHLLKAQEVIPDENLEDAVSWYW